MTYSFKQSVRNHLRNAILYFHGRLHGASATGPLQVEPLLLAIRSSWVVVFLRSCVVEYGHFPGSSALDPHFSKSNDTRRTRLKGDFWIPWIDTCEFV